MAGYAVRARIRHVEPRRVEWPTAASGAVVAPAAAMAHGSLTPESEDLVGEPFLGRLSDWVAGIGEAWSQMVFFLFDPESWRR
jgi:hypothetical protein